MSPAAIEATYRKHLQQLEETKQATDAQLELRQERDQARDAAEEAAEELAKDQPGKASELYRGAMRPQRGDRASDENPR
jgi:hypothetical protein